MTRRVLTVTSGLGPLETRRFASALAEALAQRLAERGAPEVHLIVHGDPDAPRSVDIVFRGEEALTDGLLGTHALVARSPRRGKDDRKRWYVGVACERMRDHPPVIVDEADIAYETCRAGGPGGQHVNRTASAVRARHLPSGLSVRVESERSQHQNKRQARVLLTAALERTASLAQAADKGARRARALRVERGRPVATWRLAESGRVIERECALARSR
jgi:peptide chain release factor 2/peptide chain release factor